MSAQASPNDFRSSRKDLPVHEDEGESRHSAEAAVGRHRQLQLLPRECAPGDLCGTREEVCDRGGLSGAANVDYGARLDMPVYEPGRGVGGLRSPSTVSEQTHPTRSGKS
ncbi:protein of unknown function [Nitrospira japonica]|uniref:Uncharacterized protein n=1 Tax=Nitrospira japonica TaxID=1325564 RepID=A0A1W1I361_9BACT|nr:protein of unknown function [Nitrospira japonica]